jgi:hypothetical protein
MAEQLARLADVAASHGVTVSPCASEERKDGKRRLAERAWAPSRRVIPEPEEDCVN